MSTVTILFPFDHGHSYLLPPQKDWKSLIKNHLLPNGDIWVTPSDIDFAQEIRNPLGLPLFLKLNLEESDLSKAIKSIPFCSGPSEAYAIFYPAGIGLLLVRAQVNASSRKRDELLLDWESKAYDGSFEGVAQRCSIAYRKLLEKNKIPEIGEADRSKLPLEFPWIYAIFFDTVRSGSINDVLTKSDIDWFRAKILISPDVERGRVETVFIIASAIWQMLHITDTLLDKVLYDLLYKLQTKGRFESTNLKSPESFRAFRAFCARIIDSCNTMRWTIIEDEIKFLNQIYSVWNTEMWQQSISSKTDLLALLYEQNQENRTESRNLFLTIVALVLTIVSTISAVLDLSKVDWSPFFAFIAMPIVTTFLLAFIGVIVVWLLLIRFIWGRKKS